MIISGRDTVRPPADQTGHTTRRGVSGCQRVLLTRGDNHVRRRGCWGVDAVEPHVLVVAVHEVDKVAAPRSELVLLFVLLLVHGLVLVSGHGRQVLEHAVGHPTVELRRRPQPTTHV